MSAPTPASSGPACSACTAPATPPGFGLLVSQPYTPAPAERPYGGYFDEVADALIAAMAARSIPPQALLQTTVANKEITFYIARDYVTAFLWAIRDDESLRFELASSISGVDYGEKVARRLHVVYELTSMTYRRRIRLEVAVDVDDAHVPSAVAVYPTADWQEREIWDMFGINFSGHPGSDPDPDAGRLARASAAQGLPARRDPGGIQGCRDSRPGSAEGVLMTEHSTASPGTRWRAGLLDQVRRGLPAAGPAGQRDASTAPSEDGPRRARGTDTTEGRMFTVTGGDWDDLLAETQFENDERIIINMGPQHPSTHGVLRLILELEGETVVQARSVIGYLHTGIEKSCEYRTWTQGVTFVTRADYLSPAFNEAAYCMAVEKLLGIEVPVRAQVIRVLLMELTRISSHLVALATGGMELGALTGMTAGFREREEALHLMEFLTGLRMNMAFIRPGGVAQELPEDSIDRINQFITIMESRLPEYDKLLTGQPIWKARMVGVGILPLEACMQLGITGPILRSAGLPWDLRKVMPYSGYEDYDFEVPTSTDADCYARFLLRLAEMWESLKIMKQVVKRLEEPGPGDGAGRENRLAGATLDRLRRDGQLPGVHPQDHGPVDGVADPPLQAGHRGLRGAGRARPTSASRTRAASSAATWCPPAAPGRGGCTCGIPAS